MSQKRETWGTRRGKQTQVSFANLGHPHYWDSRDGFCRCRFRGVGMNMSPELKDRLYLLTPLVWTGLLSLLARGSFLDILTHWAILLGWVVFVFVLMCLVKLFFKQKFPWQQWFFWTGIVVPMIVLTHHHWK